jgi:uncharacterized glyoxalase superfamily protein PhnB
MLANRSMPQCTVIPVIVYADLGEAVDWLCDVFGFTMRVRIGDHRAQLNIGDGAVVLRQADKGAAESGDSVMVRVEDVDGHCERAKQRGARIVEPPTDFPYGERQYTVEDFAGRVWKFSQSIADVAPEDWGGTSG